MFKLQTTTIAFIPHAGKVMLKILQARLQQYVNWELPDVQAGFRKGRGISSCESTKTAPNCCTTIDRKTLELTKKKDNPYPKKEEATAGW